MRAFSLIAITLFALPSCAFLTPPVENPVIEDTVLDGKLGTLAITADRRVFLVTENGKILAEPSPDAYTEIVSLFELSAKATKKTPGTGEETTSGTAEIGADLRKTLVTALQRLTTRSQGIVYLRDASYRLAEACVNGDLSEKDYVTLMTDVLKHSKELIEFELSLNPSLGAEPPTSENKETIDKARSEALKKAGKAPTAPAH